MSFFSAKNARVQLLGTNMFANRWTINTKVDDLDVTNFESGGFGDWIGGVKDADITFTVIWDSVQDPMNIPPGIVAGQIIGNGTVGAGGNVKFFLDSVNLTQFWSFGKILIVTASMNADVRGLITIDCTAKSKGVYAEPA